MKKIISTIVFIGIILLGGVYFSYKDTYYFQQGKKSLGVKQFDIAKFYFSKISNEAVSLHNIGNTYVQSAEEFTDAEKKQEYINALEVYSGSLSYGEDEYTRHNYEYVLQKLSQGEEDIKKEETQEDKNSTKETDVEKDGEAEKGSEESKTQDLNQEENLSGAEENNSIQEKGGSSENESSGKTLSGSQRGEQYQLEETDELESLTEEELQQLEQHIMNLKIDQQSNQNFYGKQQEGFTSRSLFDEMFQGSIFFQQKFSGGEKDW